MSHGVTIGCCISFPGILTPALQREEEGSALRGDLNTGARLVTVFTVAMTCCAGLAGLLADRYGRRPALLCTSQPLAIVAWVVFAAAGGLGELYAAHAAAGVACGAATSLALVYISEISSPQRRGRESEFTSPATQNQIFCQNFIVHTAHSPLSTQLFLFYHQDL